MDIRYINFETAGKLPGGGFVRDELTGQRQPAPRIRDIRDLEAIARELRRQVIRMIAPSGHGYVQQGLGAYATLAARGCIAPESLASYTHDGSALEVNASERLGPVIEATCGSLGQGLICCGRHGAFPAATRSAISRFM
jgi:transketolase